MWYTLYEISRSKTQHCPSEAWTLGRQSTLLSLLVKTLGKQSLSASLWFTPLHAWPSTVICMTSLGINLQLAWRHGRLSHRRPDSPNWWGWTAMLTSFCYDRKSGPIKRWSVFGFTDVFSIYTHKVNADPCHQPRGIANRMEWNRSGVEGIGREEKVMRLDGRESNAL